jgi:hypothetical protein
MTLGDIPENEVSLASVIDGAVDFENLDKYRVIETKK